VLIADFNPIRSKKIRTMRMLRSAPTSSAMTKPALLQRAATARVAAWLVHGLTASGIVLGVLALLAVEERDWRMALSWLAAALIVDGVDGPLARWAQVGKVTPDIDGNILDLVIDYFTFVLVPALLIYRAGLVPPAFALGAVALILLSSLYHYARRDLKTPDNYFNGFPALWNVVAFYLLVGQIGQVAGLLVICVLAGLTFAPVCFVHPFRVREHWPLLPGAAVLWAVSTLALLPGVDQGLPNPFLFGCSLLAAAVLLVLGALRTVRGPAPPRQARGRS
jgi:phosphatidylcholine synthase